MEESVRQIAPDIGIQVDPALLIELHDTDPDSQLGNASPFKDGICGAFHFILAVGLTKGTLIKQFILIEDRGYEGNIIVRVLLCPLLDSASDIIVSDARWSLPVICREDSNSAQKY